MKNSALLFLLLLTSALLYVACRKDNFLTPPPEIAGQSAKSPGECTVIVRGSGGEQSAGRSPEQDAPKMMVLGAQKPNPFARSIMTQAYNNIYEPNVSQVPFTHLYVRFLPADAQQYRLLGDRDDLELFDFPLDREIIESGDYYHDPTIPEDQFTWQYAVVEPDFEFPAGIQYEVLEEIVNLPFKLSLVREAFRIAYGDEEGLRQYIQSRNGDFCTPECEYYPECLESADLSCSPGGNPPPGGSGGNESTPCSPSHPDWPECAQDEIPCSAIDPLWPDCGVEEPPYAPPVTNACGCQVSSNIRYPGGCVRVVDTQLPANGSLPNGTPAHLDGVKQAKITWWNGWFGVWTTFTDDNGCWQIREEDHGVGHMWVTFKNDRAKIRGIRGARVWEYAIAVKDYVGQIGGPVFNNISVIYNTGGDLGSASLLFWYAATTNNALWEYYNFAAADGITLPPGDLKILLTNYAANAAAPMLEKTGFNWAAAGGATALIAMLFPNPFIILPVASLSAYLAAFAPDVVYNYNNFDPDSDRVKETLYHEFAHVSHYMGLPPGNRNMYWGLNIEFVLENVIFNQNPPYGFRGLPGHERCAVIEMWGFHLGPHYADRKYGLLHSRGGLLADVRESRRWLYVNEPFVPDVLGNGAPDSYIPEGLFHDLFDNNALNPPLVFEGIPTDPVTGFSQGDFFRAITQGVPQTMTGVEANINTSLPPGATPPMTRAIFGAYGY